MECLLTEFISFIVFAFLFFSSFAIGCIQKTILGALMDRQTGSEF